MTGISQLFLPQLLQVEADDIGASRETMNHKNNKIVDYVKIQPMTTDNKILHGYNNSHVL